MSRKLIIVLIAAAVAGCSSATAPLSCEGNPKCKPDTQPAVPNKLALAPASADSQPTRATRRP